MMSTIPLSRMFRFLSNCTMLIATMAFTVQIDGTFSSAILNTEDPSTCSSKLKSILLHAQANSETDGIIVGSEVTCRAFKRAFQKYFNSPHPNLDTHPTPSRGEGIHLMHPGNYTLLSEGKWDLVFIEGWFPAIAEFIHEVRRASNQKCKVFYFCLDPAFPGLNVIKKLDVDVLFTNSRQVQKLLKDHIDTEYMLLAADFELAQSVCEKEIGHSKYAHSVVYVGSAIGMTTKEHLPEMLRNAIPYGVAIYGSGWEKYPEFSPYWKGILPHEDLFKVYCSSKVVLGVTMDAQREMGMINNRVFEVLACGAILISDYFIELEETFGNIIHYRRNRGDVSIILNRIFSIDTARLGYSSIAVVNDQHTYHHRVQQIVNKFHQLHNKYDRERPNQPCVLVLHNKNDVEQENFNKMFWEASLLPTLKLLEKSYSLKVEAINSSTMHNPASNILEIFEKEQNLLFLVVVSEWDNGLDRFIRSSKLKKNAISYKVCLLLLNAPDNMVSQDASFYDVIFYKTEFDANLFANVRTNIQHAFGIDRKLFSQNNKSHPIVFNVVSLGDWLREDNQLLQFLSLKDKKKALLLFSTSVVENPGFLKYTKHILEVDFGIDTRIDIHNATNVAGYLKQTKSIFIPGSGFAGDEWVYLASIAAGIVAKVKYNNLRIKHLSNYGVSDWGIEFYSKRLQLGFTRALCLGGGNSTVVMNSPNENEVVGGSFPVYFSVFNMQMHKEGKVCLHINQLLIYCLHHAHLHFLVVLEDIDKLGIISNVSQVITLKVQLTLQSMLFSNVFFSSPLTTVTVNVSVNELEKYMSDNAIIQRVSLTKL